MEFKGAAQVDKDNLQKALFNYVELKDNYDKKIQHCKDKLSSEINTLSWWDKFWRDESYTDWFAVYKYKYNGALGVFFRNDWFENFNSVGLLSEEFYEKYKSIYEVLEAYEGVYVELSYLNNMSGEVYATPTQAYFIDKFSHIDMKSYR